MRLIRRLTAIAALLMGALLPSAVNAATLYVTEYSTIGSIGTLTTPWAPGPAVTTQQVVVGGGSLQSSAFNAQTKAVLLTCDIGCSVQISANPTAALTTTLLQQGVPYYFVVAASQKVAVIANPAGDSGGSGGSNVDLVAVGGAAVSLGQKTAANSIPVVLASDATASSAVVSAVNSTTTPLGGSAAFTGTSVNSLPYGSIIVNVFADQASATNGMSIQQSPDGTNWNVTDTFTVPASTARQFVIPRQAAFARVVYTNGATPQTTFRLQTLLNPPMPFPSAQKPADGMSIENDFGQIVAVPEVYNGTTVDIVRSVTNGLNSTGTGLQAAGAVGQFDDVSPTTITENSFGTTRITADHILMSAGAPSASVGVSVTSVVTSAAASNSVTCGTACNLYGFSLTSGASAGTVYVFNATSLPSNGAVTPVKCYQIAANSTIGVAFSPPIRMGTGATIGFGTGTNCFSLTASATAFISGDAK